MNEREKKFMMKTVIKILFKIPSRIFLFIHTYTHSSASLLPQIYTYIHYMALQSFKNDYFKINFLLSFLNYKCDYFCAYISFVWMPF